MDDSATLWLQCGQIQGKMELHGRQSETAEKESSEKETDEAKV